MKGITEHLFVTHSDAYMNAHPLLEPPCHQVTQLHVKLDSRYDKCSTKELEEFQGRLSKILERKDYIFRLLSVEKGCFKLVYVIPLRLKQAIFPLQNEQKKALIEVGVLQLICGTCYFSSNTYQGS